MKVKDLLPVGSVVLLRDGEKKLMICGVMQSNAGRPKKDYDYLGVLYPEGYISKNLQFLFNSEDIVQVFFRGYEDNERAEFINKLTDMLGPESHPSQPEPRKWGFWRKKSDN